MTWTTFLGRSVQNHTSSHVELTAVPWRRFKGEAGRTDSAIRAQTGHPPGRLRPLYGPSISQVLQRARHRG
ncbi:polysaccharide deacetylase family protein [Streptomyces sp. NBC_01320]|uniref:polysaccharide deacetylase family protein n=1 Tax=Streptomyces sp. NBC_01320 TaxID=2903824 RepID=UPI003FA34D17